MTLQDITEFQKAVYYFLPADGNDQISGSKYVGAVGFVDPVARSGGSYTLATDVTPSGKYNVSYSGVQQTRDHWLFAATAQLNALEELCDDWDARGAPAPVHASLCLARTVLDCSAARNLSVDRVLASPEGGVALYFFGGSPDAEGTYPKRACIEADNDGDVLVSLVDLRADTTRVLETATDLDSLCEALEVVYGFVSN